MIVNAKQFVKDYVRLRSDFALEELASAMVDFAKEHVKQAQEEAIDAVYKSSRNMIGFDELEQKIINSYKLTDIK